MSSYEKAKAAGLLLEPTQKEVALFVRAKAWDAQMLAERVAAKAGAK